MLELFEITKVFNSDLLKKDFVALKDVSFKIPEGTVMGFLGANGAGKTTTLKILMDFIRPTSGKIIFSDTLGTKKKDAFSNIGYLPERPFFYPHLTGRQFCHYMGELSGLKKSEVKTQVKKWASRFKIEFALDREIKTYSKGMLQRLGFLVTLLHGPKLVILDEPLSGLDPIGRKELKEIIVEINKLGTTIFFSSHIVSDVEAVCDDVLFIKSGEVLFNGSVDKIINENYKGNTIITYYDNDRLEKRVVTENEKNEVLKSIAHRSNIISVEPQRPSLEEIFYKVK